MPTYRREPDKPQRVHVENVTDELYHPLPWRSFIAGVLTVLALWTLAWAFGILRR